MVEFLTDPIVVTVLLTIAGVGIVIELFSPKFGVPGFIGVIALLLFFYGHFQSGMAGYGTLLLFGAGILLIFLEFFFTGCDFRNNWNSIINFEPFFSGRECPANGGIYTNLSFLYDFSILYDDQSF